MRRLFIASMLASALAWTPIAIDSILGTHIASGIVCGFDSGLHVEWLQEIAGTSSFPARVYYDRFGPHCVSPDTTPGQEFEVFGLVMGWGCFLAVGPLLLAGYVVISILSWPFRRVPSSPRDDRRIDGVDYDDDGVPVIHDEMNPFSDENHSSPAAKT